MGFCFPCISSSLSLRTFSINWGWCMYMCVCVCVYIYIYIYIHLVCHSKYKKNVTNLMEALQQHYTISPTSQHDGESIRVYGTAIPRMVEPEPAESRNKCHFQVQSFSQHRHSLHCLCPRRMRYLFLYSSIANFQSPCPSLLISVDKRPGGLQLISR